jgi:hypothetical protein
MELEGVQKVHQNTLSSPSSHSLHAQSVMSTLILSSVLRLTLPSDFLLWDLRYFVDSTLHYNKTLQKIKTIHLRKGIIFKRHEKEPYERETDAS